MIIGYHKGERKDERSIKSGLYSCPDSLFWNRVGNLRNAMLTAENFEFRLLYFHKLQELMRFVP